MYTTSKQHSCVQGPLRECCSIRSGASGLPYYCAPLVCVSAVIELITVWRHNKPKPKPKVRVRANTQVGFCFVFVNRISVTRQHESGDIYTLYAGSHLFSLYYVGHSPPPNWHFDWLSILISRNYIHVKLAILFSTILAI